MTTLTLRAGSPLIRTTRPSVVQSISPLVFNDDDYYTWLQSQGSRYRSTPIYVDAASVIAHRWDQPLVADRAMCVAPSVDGGYNSPSPNALIRDRWHDLVITATETRSFTSGSPTHTLSVESLDRDIAAGFVIGFTGGYLVVTADAATGATSLSLSRIFFDVAVTSGDEATAHNGFFYQRGEGSPLLDNLVLMGDPNPLINVNPVAYESTRKYACDGVAIAAMGATFNNLRIQNFPGHGLWASSTTASSTLNGTTLPWDQHELQLNNVFVDKCLSGITVLSTDTMFGKLVASACRDYGVRFTGFAAMGDSIHAYGCNVGISLQGGAFCNAVQGETCNFGIEVFNTSQIGSVRAYNNTYRGFVANAYNIQVGRMFVTHASATTIADSYATGYAVAMPAARFTCHDMTIDASNGANGMSFGTSAGNLVEARMAGRINGDDTASTYGLRITHSILGSDLDFNINRFPNCLYIDNGVTLTGNSMKFRGTSSNTIRWANGTTGTFTTPNIPAGVSSANSVSFLVY
jgi:hypothetical protein